MNILAVTHSYPRWAGDVAGSFIERLNVELVRRSHSVQVLVPADRGTRGSVVEQGIKVTRVAYASPSRETLAYTGKMADAIKSLSGLLAFQSLIRKQAREMRRIVAEESIDLVHCHWWIPAGVSAWWNARDPRFPPYAVTLHGTDVAILENSSFGRWLARKVLRNAIRVTVVSNYLADRLSGLLGLERDQIAVQPMPIGGAGNGKRETGDRKGEMSDSTQVEAGGVVTIGRLTKQKRIDVILKAFALMKAAGYQKYLRIVGDGPERPNLERLTTELGLEESVSFVGAVPPEEIRENLVGADAFAFAAEREGLGLATAEAFIWGLPVAAVDSGGVPDIVPGDGPGRLVPPNDPDALARALISLVEEPGSKQSALELGTKLKIRLSPKEVAGRFEELLEEGGGRPASHLPPPTSIAASTRQSLISIVAQLVLLSAVVFFVWRNLASSWTQFDGLALSDFKVDPLPVVGASALVLCSYFLLINAWRTLVVGWGSRLATKTAAAIWCLSNMGRYLPGKIWAVAGMAVLASRGGVDPIAATGSAVVMQALSLGTGVAIASGTLLSVPDALSPPATVALILAMCVSIAATILLSSSGFLELASRLTGRELRPVSASTLVIAGVITTASWMVYGLTFWILIGTVVAGHQVTYLVATGIFAASYILGFVMVLVPGGLGVREGAVVVLLTPLLGPAAALVTSILSRVLFTITEIVAVGIVLPFAGSVLKRERSAGGGEQ